MPLSSGAHGWSLKYINKPPRPRKSPEYYFYTAEIPHSHKRYRRNTTEDNIPPVESIGQPGTRRPQWYPVNQHRLLGPDPFNFTHSSWEGKLNQRNNNDFRFESSPDTRKKTFAPLRQEITTGPVRAEERQFDEDSSDQNQTFTGNSFTSGNRGAPPPLRRKLVYPVNKFKEVKLVQKDDNESRVSKPQEQLLLAKRNGIPDIKDSNSNSIETENSKKTDDIQTNQVKHPNIVAHRIANSIINEKDEGKEESQNRLSDNNKSLVEDLHINENSGRGSSPDQRTTPKPDTSKIVPVAIPPHSLRGSESSQTPSLTSSRCDIKRQETDLGNICESLKNVKNAPDNNIDKYNPKPEASVSTKGSNANYLTNNTTNNAQNNSSRVKNSDQETKGSGGKKKKNDQIDQKEIQKDKDVIAVKPSLRENSVDTRENNERSMERKSSKTKVSKTKHTIIAVDELGPCKDQVKSVVTFTSFTFHSRLKVTR